MEFTAAQDGLRVDVFLAGCLPELGLHSQCLHAKELTFLHPRTGEEMTLSCPLPEEFEHALKKLQRTMGL